MAVCALAACEGPRTIVANPDEHPTFVDGRRLAADSLPFRYYGTSRWDALPKDGERRPDFARQPASAAIELPPPASPWLFPFDFPLEVLRRLTVGREDVTATVALPPTPPEQVVHSGVRPVEVDQLAERAAAARILR